MNEPLLEQPSANRHAMPFAPALILLASFAVVLFVLVVGTAGSSARRGESRLSPLAAGESDYVRYCSACHGIDGQGVEFFGPGFVGSQLLADNDMALIAFITEGRPLADPRVEFPHPFRGGYPRLTDGQITNLVRYLHQIPATNSSAE